MHGYFLYCENKFNVALFVGDIQLRSSVSFMLNQIKWKLSFTTFKSNRSSFHLRFQVENFHLDHIIGNHHTFLSKHNWHQWVLEMQRWCIHLCTRHICEYWDEFVNAYQKWWMLSLTKIRARKPFGAPNFIRALERICKYISYIQYCGIEWLWLRFNFPLIWLPIDRYHPLHRLTYANIEDWWKEVILTNGYRPHSYDMHVPYDLNQIHARYSGSNLDLKSSHHEDMQ